MCDIEKEFRYFIKNDFYHLNLKVDTIEEKVKSKTTLIMAILTLIIVLVK